MLKGSQRSNHIGRVTAPGKSTKKVQRRTRERLFRVFEDSKVHVQTDPVKFYMKQATTVTNLLREEYKCSALLTSSFKLNEIGRIFSDSNDWILNNYVP